MSEEKLYITSIDALLDLFNAQIDRDLPDPEKFNGMQVCRPIARTSSLCMPIENAPEASFIEREYFYKERVCFDDRQMWVWRKK